MDYELNALEQRDMFIYAFRYALGRRTYASHTMANAIIRNWDKHSEMEKQLFVREIKQAIDRNMAGDNCDIAEWEKVLARAEK